MGVPWQHENVKKAPLAEMDDASSVSWATSKVSFHFFNADQISFIYLILYLLQVVNLFFWNNGSVASVKIELKKVAEKK
jgi:hypothetical protein